MDGSSLVKIENLELDKLLKAGNAPDINGYTKAGRNLTKKSYRKDSVFQKPIGTVEEVNSQGQKVLQEILEHPNKLIENYEHPRFGSVTAIKTPQGGWGSIVYKREQFYLFYRTKKDLNEQI